MRSIKNYTEDMLAFLKKYIFKKFDEIHKKIVTTAKIFFHPILRSKSAISYQTVLTCKFIIVIYRKGIEIVIKSLLYIL